MAAAEKIQFVDTDPQVVADSLVSYYENLTGKRLQPAQVERIEFNAVAYRMSLLLNSINEAANQNLAVFASGRALELLAELMGVFRLPASSAQCTIRFDLVAGHNAFNFAAGMRIQSIDGQVVFITIEDKDVADTDSYVDIKCECTKTGEIGNGYAIGNINIILDPRPYVSAAGNLDITSGGGDDESDDALRARVLLAPSQFSVAGPKGAYKFWALSAHPSIVDVAVTIGHANDSNAIVGGQVDIFPLLKNNQAPTQEITDLILAICNDEKIRPLTDTVYVKSPEQLDYTIVANVTILDTGNSQIVQDEVTARLQSYVDSRKNKLGIDAVRSQIVAAGMGANVYNITLAQPSSDIVAAESEFANCTNITVNIIGTHDA